MGDQARRENIAGNPSPAAAQRSKKDGDGRGNLETRRERVATASDAPSEIRAQEAKDVVTPGLILLEEQLSTATSRTQKGVAGKSAAILRGANASGPVGVWPSANRIEITARCPGLIGEISRLKLAQWSRSGASVRRTNRDCP